jgi:hypothetical protein
MSMVGQHTRLYFAFVTTAPADLDSPATMTLHASTFSDVSGRFSRPGVRRVGVFAGKRRRKRRCAAVEPITFPTFANRHGLPLTFPKSRIRVKNPSTELRALIHYASRSRPDAYLCNKLAISVW